jgi:uncharacterized protein (TIGR02118 family)
MIKFSFLIQRLPAMSFETFVDYHKNKHAPLFASIPEAKQYVRKYVVSHPIAAPGFSKPVYDGITDIYFDSFEDYHQFFSTKNFLDNVNPDHNNFIDMANVIVLVTDETVIIATKGE